MRLYPLAADAIDSGDFPGAGDAAVVPDLHGKINNPIPFLPPLALIDVLNLHLRFGAPQFAVAGNGSFSADVTVTAISGTLNITPLIGSPSSSDLTGNMSTPQTQAGTLLQNGTALALSVPINTTFQFSDPGTGASGSITIIGTLKANWTCPAAQIYCTAKVNSLGCTPAIAASGTASYTNAAPFTISAANELNQKSGLLFYGFAPSSAPFQGGIKCVAPPTLRSAIQNSGGSASGSDCSGSYSYDFNARIQSFADPLLVPGEEVFAQYWSRDPQSASTDQPDQRRALHDLSLGNRSSRTLPRPSTGAWSKRLRHSGMERDSGRRDEFASEPNQVFFAGLIVLAITALLAVCFGSP
jgi:hypothetical protein